MRRRLSPALALAALASLSACAKVSGLSELEFECFPDPLSQTCAGLECGTAINNCGDPVDCPDQCQPAFACEAGGAPANTCGCTGGDHQTPPPPDGCVAMQGTTTNTYYVCTTTADFDGARAACRDFGTDLAVINSLAENAYLRQQLVQKVFLGLLAPGCTEGACAYEWVDGTPLDPAITFWNPGEPNNQDGAEHCVELRPEDGRWNDIACATRRGILCETTCPPIAPP